MYDTEITAGAASMYDNVAVIQNLNKVDNFDPRKFMRIIKKEGEPGKYYLDVAYRKLWFRLSYPKGKIEKRVLKLTDQTAVVEARIYLDCNEPESSFIANAYAQKYLTDDDQFGNKFVELAETAAVGRALADAGFGLQFADMEQDYDPDVSDAPFDAQLLPGRNVIDICENKMEVRSEPKNAESPAIEYAEELDTKRPAEEIYAMLNRNSAATVVIPSGYNKGKTLGQLAIEKPGALEWYINSYNGPNNLLRAAAKFLMDAALKAA